MKNSARIFSLIAGLFLLEAAATAVEWHTDLVKAQAIAKAEKKMVLLDFTGSDWCGSCIMLDKEVFSTKQFGDYAKKNLVLVKVDFPMKKALKPALKRANQELKEKFDIEGFPTFVVLNSDGKELGREVGYAGDGPKPVIAQIEQFRKK
jgi:thioredoxin-related protein